jgi:phosphoglycolate phosphatase
MAPVKTVLITDFDNTLYDWFHMWFQSFDAMLTEIEAISGIRREDLIPEIRAIHQKYGTSEYAFLIQAMPSLAKRFAGDDLTKVFDPAIHAYRSARKRSLQLYDGVMATLVELRKRGITIVLYTDSLAFYTGDRVKRLGLDGVVDFLYSPPDHEIPALTPSYAQGGKHQLELTQHRYLRPGEQKPNPEVLADILSGIGKSKEDCIYVGDSLLKDIAMAQDAGVTDVYAEYGRVQDKREYELLQQVSHWTEEMVQREKVTSKREVKPTFSIEKFSDVIRFFGG